MAQRLVRSLTYTLPNTPTGLTLALNLTVGLRAAGFKTRLVETTINHFEVVTVYATPPARPNRQERGER
jgi:hypothetical protein